MNQKILTIQAIYREGTRKLKEAGIEEASLDAWYLLEHAAGISRASYYLNPERGVEVSMEREYFQYIDRRTKREPLQHITGEQEFMGYSFCVNKHVLIPRQDTEILVGEALGVTESGMQILDMCTGSGCVLLSILKMAAKRYKVSDLTGTGADISEKALAVAEENARRLSVQAQFTVSDLFAEIDGKYDLIVSNPPYIRTAVIRELQKEVKNYDPAIALDGKEDGLYFYRRIIKDSVDHIDCGGHLLFEIGYDQGEAVSELMKQAGYSSVIVKKDLAGLDRVVSGMYNEGKF